MPDLPRQGADLLAEFHVWPQQLCAPQTGIAVPIGEYLAVCHLAADGLDVLAGTPRSIVVSLTSGPVQVAGKIISMVTANRYPALVVPSDTTSRTSLNVLKPIV